MNILLIVATIIAILAIGILIAINTNKSKKPCEHKFVFHDPEIMEHEPFCEKCRKTLTEING